MLVLGRWAGQRLMVGDDVKITVLSVCNDQVTFGIQAPKSVPLHREEIHRRIHKLPK